MSSASACLPARARPRNAIGSENNELRDGFYLLSPSFPSSSSSSSFFSFFCPFSSPLLVVVVGVRQWCVSYPSLSPSLPPSLPSLDAICSTTSIGHYFGAAVEFSEKRASIGPSRRRPVYSVKERPRRRERERVTEGAGAEEDEGSRHKHFLYSPAAPRPLVFSSSRAGVLSCSLFSLCVPSHFLVASLSH